MARTSPSPAPLMKAVPAAPVAAAAAAASMLLAACGTTTGTTTSTSSASPSTVATAIPSAPLVTPTATVVQLTDDELEDLARNHRILTAAFSATAVTGAMVSDIAPQQQYTAPRPASTAALNTLVSVLKQGDATVTGVSSRR